MSRSRLITVVLVAAASVVAAPLVAQQRPFSAADIEDGQRLFVGSCANCHGPDGDSVPGVDLGHGLFRRGSTDSELVDIIRREPQWVFQTRSLEKFEATALVVDGIMYTVQAPNDIVALDAATGRTFWV